MLAYMVDFSNFIKRNLPFNRGGFFTYLKASQPEFAFITIANSGDLKIEPI